MPSAAYRKCLAKRERKGGPLAHDTLHGHLPAVRGHHLLHDIEAQAGPPGFRRIQRLENLGCWSGGMPTAGILHVEQDHGRVVP